MKGFSEAIEVSFLKCEVQLCIVHQIRNSIKLVPSKLQKAFINDLKTVYKASSKEIAESNLLARDCSINCVRIQITFFLGNVNLILK